MRHQRHHGGCGFDAHPIVPNSLGAGPEIGRLEILGDRALVGEDDHALFVLRDEGQEAVVVNVSLVDIPIHDPSKLIGDKVELGADDPTLVGKALGSELLGRTPLAARMEQLDTVGIGHAQDRWLGQQGLGQLGLGGQAAEEAGAFGKVGEEVEPVVLEPAVEGPLADALEGEEQTKGDQLAQSQFFLGMTSLGAKTGLDTAEEIDDKVGDGHGGGTP